MTKPGKKPPLAVAIACDRLAMFEFGIATEFFALARPELDFVPYRFAVADADPLPLTACALVWTADWNCCGTPT